MAESTKTVVFVDPNVADYRNIVDSVKPGTLLFLLSAGGDGIDQITQNLSGLTNIDSLQIISQGSEGSLSLGSIVLNSANLSTYTSQLSSGVNLSLPQQTFCCMVPMLLRVQQVKLLSSKLVS